MFLESIKSVIVECGVVRLVKDGQGERHRALVCPAKESGTYPEGSGSLRRVKAGELHAPICIF